MTAATFVVGMDDRNPSSVSSDRSQNGGDSSSVRSPVSSMIDEDHHQLLGERPSAVPLIMSSGWNDHARNLSTKSSMSTRRYRIALLYVCYTTLICVCHFVSTQKLQIYSIYSVMFVFVTLSAFRSFKYTLFIA